MLPESLYNCINGLHLFEQDPVSKTGIFRAPLIQTIINKTWFKYKDDEGVIHPEFSENNTLPMATIAFVLTVVSYIFWNSVEFSSLKTSFRSKITLTSSVWKSSPGTGKRPGLDWTLTGQDRKK
jgi:hypothetical protein